MIVYAIKLGGRLWIENGFGFNQRSTSKLIYAKFYEDYDQALRAAKRAHGTVAEINIAENDGSEIDMLRASIKQLQTERDAALNELNLFKLNHKNNKEQK